MKVDGPREFRTIQALRAAACLLVVAYHASQKAAGGGEPWPNGAAGVDLFFVISGAVMILSSTRLPPGPAGAAAFIRHRLLRIVPLYWLLTAAKLALSLARPDATPHSRPDALNALASFLFLPARDAAGLVRPVLPVGWTLQFEILFYAGFAACLAARLAPTRWLPLALAPLAVLGFWRLPDTPSMFFCNGLVLEFCAGMAIGQLILARRLPGPAAATALILAGSVALMALPSAGPWRFLLWGLPAASIVAGAAALEPSLGARLPRPLLAIGDASYAIYLTHPFVVARLSGIVPILLAGTVLGFVTDRVIDRPLRALIKGKGRGASRPPSTPAIPWSLAGRTSPDRNG